MHPKSSRKHPVFTRLVTEVSEAAQRVSRAYTLQALVVAVRQRTGNPHADIAEATVAEKAQAFTYGATCGRAFAKRWAKHYGLLDKYCPITSQYA